MKRLMSGILACTLGWAAAAWSGELPQRSDTAAAPAVTLGRPVVVSLGRPTVSADDPGVRPASFESPAALARPLIRMQGADSRSTWASGQERPVSSGGSQFATGNSASDIRPASFAVGAPVVSGGPVTSGPVTSTPPGESLPGMPATEDGCFACDGTCGCCDPCCPDCCDKHGCRFYGSAEYLLWALRDQRFPALVTTGARNNPQTGGFLNDPSTRVLFGGLGEAVHSNEFSGGRFTLGWWCDPCETKGLEFSFFFLGQKSIHFGATGGSGGQFPVLGRPFFDLSQGIEFAEFTALSNLVNGRVDVTSNSRLWGAEVNGRCRWCCQDCCCDCLDGCALHFRMDLLYGFRYADLTEQLRINEATVVTNALVPPPPPPLVNDPVGTQAFISDRFGTRNNFYGGQVGTDINFTIGQWSFDFLGKVALGDTHQVVDIEGNTTKVLPGGVMQTAQGGLLALPSNSGRFTRDRFAVLPELGVKIGYHVTDNLLLTAGYTWMYWSSVVRPGDQIDRVLDARAIPSFFQNLNPLVAMGARPVVPFRSTDFWAQGVSFGLEYNY